VAYTNLQLSMATSEHIQPTSRRSSVRINLFHVLSIMMVLIEDYTKRENGTSSLKARCASEIYNDTGGVKLHISSGCKDTIRFMSSNSNDF
jgi:hypothetical protein